MITVCLWTFDCALELSVHQIDNYGLTSFEMVLPRLLACLDIIIAVVLAHGHQRLLFDAIQVFVETIEQDVQELL